MQRVYEDVAKGLGVAPEADEHLKREMDTLRDFFDMHGREVGTEWAGTILMPLAVVGGPVRGDGGRHLVFRDETPMTNLLLGLLDKVSVRAEKLGDSTGRIAI